MLKNVYFISGVLREDMDYRISSIHIRTSYGKCTCIYGNTDLECGTFYAPAQNGARRHIVLVVSIPSSPVPSRRVLSDCIRSDLNETWSLNTL